MEGHLAFVVSLNFDYLHSSCPQRLIQEFSGAPRQLDIQAHGWILKLVLLSGADGGIGHRFCWNVCAVSVADNGRRAVPFQLDAKYLARNGPR